MTEPAVTVLPVRGLPEVTPGDDLAALVAARADLRDGDVVVVAQKVVSKAEGAVAWPEPGEDPAAARRRLAREAAARVVVDTGRVLIVETAHGFVCANAGVDASNVPGGALTLLPADPDASARRLRAGLAERAGADVGVIVADTFGRPWRLGQTDVAIGVAGVPPIRDDRGGRDRHGHVLEVTEAAVADEIAGAADLVRGKADGVPVVVVRGLRWSPDDGANARSLVRGRDEDLFSHGSGTLADALGAGTSAGSGPAGAHPAGGGDAPVHGPVRAGDLARAAAAGRRAGAGRVDVAVIANPPATVAVCGSVDAAVEAGAAAATTVAALVDAGYAAGWRRGRPDEAALAVVEAGPAAGGAHPVPPDPNAPGRGAPSR